MKHKIHTLADLRAALPITQEFIYLQTGTRGPVPTATQRFMARLQREENERAIGLRGQASAAKFQATAQAARASVAEFLGIDAAQLAWCENTSMATRLAALSLPWQAGDKLATSDVEHASTLALAAGLRQHRGVATTIIPSGPGPSYNPAYFLEQLDRYLTPDHRLLILCHVANTDGRRLPVKEAVQLARSRGVKTLIDGAQALGVFPVNVASIGADFYSGALHKWLLGPAGVGFLAVHPEQLVTFNPHQLPIDPDHTHAITASSQAEVGTTNQVLRCGAAYSLELLLGIGQAALEGQMRSLTEQLREGLRSLAGIHNISPTTWENSSSITTFQRTGGNASHTQQLVTTLRERYKIIAKMRPEVNGVRVTVAAFNTAVEIDRLLAALSREAS